MGSLGPGEEIQGRAVVCLESEKRRTLGVPEVLEDVSYGCWCQERWRLVWKEALSWRALCWWL